ncbi:hypothetical protein FRC04_002385 [Tulasnella sp. 424]|nr:hypothetical protein FRC04_002385 [Tulasnella sp. 424]KAG8968356.1 hypothetical protein FRC05_001580 [Tulasnella sp. 425]
MIVVLAGRPSSFASSVLSVEYHREMKSTTLFLSGIGAATLGIKGALGIAIYGQCGGIGYTGSTSCDAGLTCTYVSDYYSQCLSASTTTSKTSTTTAGTTTTTSSSSNSIDAKFKAHGKQYFGTCGDQSTLSVAQDSAIVQADFGQLTPLSSMNWDATASTLTSVIQNHATTIVTRYKGKVAKYDVVNEIFNDDGTLRSSIFSNLLGDTFVDIAFNAAHAADSSAKLYINNYNLDSVNAKLNSLVSLVDSKRSAGIPIHGIGSETHLDAGGSSGVQALTALAASSVDDHGVAITELDILGGAASDYVTVIKACLAVSKCVGITVWGVSDKDATNWRSSRTPLLFTTNYQPKAAYNAILNAL